MHTFKIITTVLIVFMIFIIAWFGRNFTWERDKASVIGFGFMEIVYLLSLICIWL